MNVCQEIERQFGRIEMLFSEEQMQDFCRCKWGDLAVYHFGLGTWIRNTLLKPGSRLHQLFLQCGVEETDDMSWFVIQLFSIYQKEMRQVDGKF